MKKKISVHKTMKYKQYLLGLFFIVLTGCSGYTKKDGKVYLRSSNEARIGVRYLEVENADYSSFDVINHNTNLDLAKDKNHVFIGTSILADAEPSAFEHIKEYYWKDNNHVYLLRFGDTDCKIKQADIRTFEVIDDNLWAKDKHHIYYGFDKLNGADPKKFKAIDEDWGKDDSFFYWHELRIDSLDYASAIILSPYYIKDKQHVYYNDRLVEGANASAFVPDGVGSFGHDDKNMYDREKNEGPITEQYRRTYIDKE
nr:DKNYY domain-containing protein [Pontibacter harenae]